MHRWIMYVSQNFPGNISFDLEQAMSLPHARAIFQDFCRAVGTDECSATLYAHTAEAWESAEEFRDTGCPFGYPDRIIERGPRGGIRVMNT